MLLQKIEGKEEVYGEGPRGRSEYRVMFPSHEKRSRIREVYPRHMFYGFAPLDKNRKPVTRDASVHLASTEKDLSKNLIPASSDKIWPLKGEMHPREASIEVISPFKRPNATVPAV